MNLKKLKPLHWLYNMLNYKKLSHNREAYKKYNLNKSLIASISSKDFPDKESRAWLDTGDSEKLAPSKEGFENFPADIQSKIRNWSKNGFMVLEGFLDDQTCTNINLEIDKLVESGKLHFTNGNKLMFANKKSALIRDVTQKPELK